MDKNIEKGLSTRKLSHQWQKPEICVAVAAKIHQIEVTIYF